MSITKEYVEYLAELFSIIPDTSVKKMFGGVGVFRHGLMFAVSLKSGKIALKADYQTIPDFQEQGCTAWVYENAKSGKQVNMGYWYAPEHILDEPDELEKWALNAFEAAARIDTKKPPSQRKLSQRKLGG